MLFILKIYFIFFWFSPQKRTKKPQQKQANKTNNKEFISKCPFKKLLWKNQVVLFQKTTFEKAAGLIPNIFNSILISMKDR